MFEFISVNATYVFAMRWLFHGVIARMTVVFGCTSMQIRLSLRADGDDMCGDCRVVALKERGDQETHGTPMPRYLMFENKQSVLCIRVYSFAGTSKLIHESRSFYFM